VSLDPLTPVTNPRAALPAALRHAQLPSRALAADDAVRAGIQTVTRQVTLHANGTRGLYLAPSCPWTIAEYTSYQYPPDGPDATPGGWGAGGMGGMGGGGGMDGWPGAMGGITGGGQAGEARSELPLKANDHALDATRYALHTALRQTRAVESYLETWLGWRRPGV
jgi:hypothetical protein